MDTSDRRRFLRNSSPAQESGPAPNSFFDIVCDDRTTTQQLLNDLYGYKQDLITKTYHRSRIALFQRLLKKLIRNGVIANFGNALDIGCNAGFYSKVLSDFGFRNVFGIDINPKYIVKASAAFGSNVPDKSIAFETLNATALPRTRLYDFILCTEVIEHTHDPNSVIQSIVALLAPGGIAVVSLPNCISLGYLTPYIADTLRGRQIDTELRDHLKYPFYKAPGLFQRNGARVICTAGVNCLFNDFSLRVFHRTPLFPALNRLNFWLSGRAPFKWLAQFFFFAIATSPLRN
jgi:2-polyprenyl-3-methyl-5-hydroxy-6-metoxy-1,4-benzoquinol methylase